MRVDLIQYLCFLKTSNLNPVSSVTVSDKEMVAMPFLSGVSPYFCLGACSVISWLPWRSCLHQVTWSCVSCRSEGAVQFWYSFWHETNKVVALVGGVHTDIYNITLNLDNKSNILVFWSVNRLLQWGLSFTAYMWCLMAHIFDGSWKANLNSFHSFVLKCIEYVWCYSLMVIILCLATPRLGFLHQRSCPGLSSQAH